MPLPDAIVVPVARPVADRTSPGARVAVKDEALATVVPAGERDTK